MTDSLKNLVIICSTMVLVMALISLMFMGFTKGKNFADMVTGKMHQTEVTMDEGEYLKYEGRRMTGSEVISAVKYFQGELIPICIEVNGICYIYTDETLQTASMEDIKKTTKKGNAEYINPEDMYIGQVNRDPVSGAIVKITFVNYPPLNLTD